MNRSSRALVCTVLFACLALAACGPPEARLPVSADPAASSGGIVDAGVQQRVKNLCMDQLQVQVSTATPSPGQLRASPKVTLVRVKYLGEVKRISLPDSASGYELGIEFDYKIGQDDSKTATKFCLVDLADSTVDWKWTASP
jgi:hypothetical protein